jgi:hypothetical protein
VPFTLHHTKILYPRVDELQIWLGIVIYMGVHSSPAVADYWVNDNLSPVHPIRSYTMAADPMKIFLWYNKPEWGVFQRTQG